MLAQDPLTGYLHEVPDSLLGEPEYGGYDGGLGLPFLAPLIGAAASALPSLVGGLFKGGGGGGAAPSGGGGAPAMAGGGGAAAPIIIPVPSPPQIVPIPIPVPYPAIPIRVPVFARSRGEMSYGPLGPAGPSAAASSRRRRRR
jgi:hypothetical protein